MRRRRVLLALYELSRTGAPGLILDAFEVMRNEFDVRILAIHGGGLEERARSLAPTVVLRRGRSPRSRLSRARGGLSMLAQTAKAELLLRGWRPDVIYLNSAASLSIARLKLPKVPVILHVHESAVLLRSLLEAQRTSRELVDLPTRYIAVSPPVRDGLIEHDVDPSRIVHIPGFVNASRFAEEPRAESGHARRFIVGGAGTPSWYKGTELWLLTASEVRRRLGADRVKFTWLGLRDDDAGRQFAAMAMKLRLDDMVEIMAETQRPVEIVREFDLLALTSWEDSFPLIALEAMALQKPVVCFARGSGIPSMLGDTGVVVDDFSPTAMADAIVALLGDQERLRAMGIRARERVLETFTTDHQVPAIAAEIRRAGSDRAT